MISFIGMILGLLLFVVLAFKGFNLILSAVASSCLMFVFSGISILDGLKEFYLPGLAGFLQSYFLLFFLSALMGKLMSDGGNAKKIALSLSGLIKKSKNNQKFFCVLLVPVLYFILCYVGISGFVVVFTVLPIAKTIYEETDTPWRLYCCGGAQRRLSGRFYSGGQCICYGYLRHNHHGGLEAFHCCSGHILGGIPGVFMDHVKNNTEKRGSVPAIGRRNPYGQSG